MFNNADFNHTMNMSFIIGFEPIQDGSFRGCSRMGVGDKKVLPSVKCVTHILQKTCQARLYLTRKRPKICMNHMAHPLRSADISSLHIQISFWYIIFYYFNFF